MRQVDGQGLTGLEGLAAAWIPALEMLHLDVEALGNQVHRVAFLNLVLHGLLVTVLCAGAGNGLAAGFAGTLAGGVRALTQCLTDAEFFAGQLVPALQVFDVNLVGLGDGGQVVAAADFVAARA